MKRAFTALVFLGVILSSVSSVSAQTQEWNKQNIELELGESQELGDYTLSYQNDGTGIMLELKYGEEDQTQEILAQFEQDEILDSVDDINYSSDERGVRFQVDELAFDERAYLNISVSSRQDIFTDSELSTTAPDHLISRRNDEIDVPLTLENQGVANETYQLRTENNTQLDVNYGYDSFNISEIQLEEGESQKLDAVIEIPEEAVKGMHELTFVAEGANKFTETVDVEVRGEEKDRRLELDLRENFKNIESGEEVKVPVTVVNRGEVELRNVNITTTLPDGWEGSVRPQIVDSLRERYGRERASLSVTPPAEVQPGDYFVEISAFSDKTAVREPQEVRIHVREKSGLAWVGVAVMAFSILLLVLVQRRFKRR